MGTFGADVTLLKMPVLDLGWSYITQQRVPTKRSCHEGTTNALICEGNSRYHRKSSSQVIFPITVSQTSAYLPYVLKH